MKKGTVSRLVLPAIALVLLIVVVAIAQKREAQVEITPLKPIATKPAAVPSKPALTDDAKMAAGFEKLAAELEVKQVAPLKPPASSGDLFTIITPVKASVASYKVKADLSNVVNRATFKNLLNAKQRAQTAANGFTVSPTDYLQMSEIYDVNTYARPLEIPSFITADAMLHMYHIFYDYSLRTVESGKLYDRLEALTYAMLKQSEKDYAEAKAANVKEAARGNVAYFAVAWNLLGHKDVPAYVAKEVKADLAAIEAHEKRGISSVLGVGIDFSQFVPRGHYTRTEKFKRFFKAMMWYGLSPLPLPDPTDPETIQQCRKLTLRALLIARDLKVAGSRPGAALKLWESIYEPTAFYVGVADDFTPGQYSKLCSQVYGKAPGIEAFADDRTLSRFISEAGKLPGPGIRTELLGVPGGPQFRFMGQRFVFDSRVLQEMTKPLVRSQPTGTDVFAAMGSKRAYDLSSATLTGEQIAFYKTRMTKMKKEVAEKKLSVWTSNLYYGWLWGLWPMTTTYGQGYPSFMRTPAWVDRNLNGALGSWAELRHDTILYAKQSATSECGGDSEKGKEPPLPKGYVEPNVELWSRLLWLTQRTETGLEQRRLLTPTLEERFDWMAGWLAFLRDASVKELAGKELTRQEYMKIRLFGAELENQLLKFENGELTTETDRDMAVVADVHTTDFGCLEEAVGHPAAIYVVVPIAGKLYLTRGAVFSYYEFVHPVADRLTDEKWQEMLDSRKEPAMPEWTRSFITPGKRGLREPAYSEPGGC